MLGPSFGKLHALITITCCIFHDIYLLRIIRNKKCNPKKMVNNLNPEDLIKSIWALQMTRKEQWLHYNWGKKNQGFKHFSLSTPRPIILKTNRETEKYGSTDIFLQFNLWYRAESSARLIWKVYLQIFLKMLPSKLSFAEMNILWWKLGTYLTAQAAPPCRACVFAGQSLHTKNQIISNTKNKH